MKILVLDNYDSFTYNLVHLVESVSRYKVDVARNDELSLSKASEYDRIILSPGPGIPDEAGTMKELIRELAPSKSILGVCLGMQGIAEVFHGKLYNLERVYHGISSTVRVVREDELFEGLPGEWPAGRYHSWALDPALLPEELEVTAVDEAGIPMALRHKRYRVKGVQFHPESVMTPYGGRMISNWLGCQQPAIHIPGKDDEDFEIDPLRKGYLFC